MKRSPGIIGAGNWIVDTTKIIDAYPSEDTLANIVSEQRNNGGGAFNILADIAKLGATFPLHALGLIGNDADGDWIIEHCRSLGISTATLSRHPEAHTSYTDVMTVRDTGRRTFFHQRGANRFFSSEHIDWNRLEGRIFYLGYLLLLDGLDQPDSQHGTVAAGVLKQAGERGYYRVVDLVSTNRPDFREVIAPSLPQIDLLICNELEAEYATGVAIRDAKGKYRKTSLIEAALCLLEQGVRDRVVIHLPEGAVACSKNGEVITQGSVRFPKEKIGGAAGAGDAFAAGLIYGIHEQLPVQRGLLQGVCTAAACLRHPTTSEGILPMQECLEIGKRCGFSEL